MTTGVLRRRQPDTQAQDFREDCYIVPDAYCHQTGVVKTFSRNEVVGVGLKCKSDMLSSGPNFLKKPAFCEGSAFSCAASVLWLHSQVGCEKRGDLKHAPNLPNHFREVNNNAIGYNAGMTANDYLWLWDETGEKPPKEVMLVNLRPKLTPEIIRHAEKLEKSLQVRTAMFPFAQLVKGRKAD